MRNLIKFFLFVFLARNKIIHCIELGKYHTRKDEKSFKDFTKSDEKEYAYTSKRKQNKANCSSYKGNKHKLSQGVKSPRLRIASLWPLVVG